MTDAGTDIARAAGTDIARAAGTAVQVWAEVSARTGVKRYIDLSPRQRNAYWREVQRRKERQYTESKGPGTRDLGLGQGTRD